MFDHGDSGGDADTASCPDACDCCRTAEYVVDYDTGPQALDALRGFATAENIAAAHKILTLAAFARRGIEDDIDRLGEYAAAERGGRGAETEAALSLAMSATTIRRYLAVGDQLDHHLPLTRAAFLAGKLDYPRVRMICQCTDQISDATLTAVEPLVVDAALQAAPGRLAREIMRLLIRVNPDEAEQARRRRERHGRRISVTPDAHGMATLYATLTAAEGLVVEGLIEQIAATVCPRDPRTRANLLVDGFVALIHGEQHLACRCDDPGCRTKLLPVHVREHGHVDVQVHVDLETLLGLVDDPAFLSGHGPIDPEMARRMAEDATWQAIISDARDIKAGKGRGSNGSGGGMRSTTLIVGGDGGCEAGEPGRTAEPVDVDMTAQPSDTADADADIDPTCVPCGPGATDAKGSGSASDSSCEETTFGDNTATDEYAPGAPTRTRGRRRPAGATPPGPDEPPPTWHEPPPRTDLTPERTVGDILDSIAANPDLLAGEFSDGHGGYEHPPDGALTYRPSAAVRRAVFAKYSTCTFPGCTVPTRRCQFDHIVEFDHPHPARGGWTVETNGEPACTLHHQAKTDRHFRVIRLPGDVIVWISRNGAIGVTLPDRYAPAPPPRPASRPAVPEPPPPDRAPADHEAGAPPDLAIYEPTWWEIHMHPGDLPPTLDELTTVTDPEHLAHCRRLRAHHAEHLGIVHARYLLAPPPF
ncbi:HNH endonuclease [Rhodococcus kronopolitis]|uniref:DUF222 domain-containing protein n=1 Tax=Rhodococcus kronopolitis TaxID=1460226 RepID=A0ABV9FPD6_9NOCA